jgi:hypothetical protein
MVRPVFITGEAGAGKTRRLMTEASALGNQLVTEPFQRALALAVMHGARRRLQSSLKQYCPALPVTVSTIHSFSLGIVNRWRRALGLAAPVSACETSCGLREKHYRTPATFDEIMEMCCKLLESPIVLNIIGKSYPLMIVDEFQDCTKDTLRFVQSLGKCSRLLIAGDHFQTLQEGVQGCPAVEWAEQLKEDDRIEYIELPGCRRTENREILDAARCLRSNVESANTTVPVYHAPTFGPAAYRMVHRFLPWNRVDRITSGTCALIVLSTDDPLLNKLIASFNNQMARKNLVIKIRWELPVRAEQHQQEVLAELGISDPEAGSAWNDQIQPTSALASSVARELLRFARLRGISPIPQELAIEFTRTQIHHLRAFGWRSPRFQILTVHGAKNQEFDHVFVFWGYKNAAWSYEQQRKLLYNAVTRAKQTCSVLCLGGEQRALSDPIIRLLGPPAPAIDPAWKRSSK